jgi:protein-tyrosine phosphatase
VTDALELVRSRGEATQRGQTVVVTYIGGLGRSGTLAACVPVSAGPEPQAAIAAVGPRALKTIAQEDFMVMFAAAISGARWLSRLDGLRPTEWDRRHTAST